MTFVTDQLGHRIECKSRPSRIISTVPSQTEVLFDLGLNEEVVGITRFCVHPPSWLKTKTKVGGTKNINIKRVQKLKPELVIANKEENLKETIEEIREICPVYVSDVKDHDSAMAMIKDIGKLTGRSEKASEWVQVISQARESLVTREPQTAAYMIWKEPWMTVGGDTFIDYMMKKAGFLNCFHDQKRYPETDLDSLAQLNPQYILLSSEPYAFRKDHIKEVKSACPTSRVEIVDGELFSWYGTRMKNAYSYFNRLFSDQ